MSQPEAAQALLDRALPFTEPWRSKPIWEMTVTEREWSKRDAEDSIKAAEYRLNDESEDYEDRCWAYESLVRARRRLAELKELDGGC